MKEKEKLMKVVIEERDKHGIFRKQKEKKFSLESHTKIFCLRLSIHFSLSLSVLFLYLSKHDVTYPNIKSLT